MFWSSGYILERIYNQYWKISWVNFLFCILGYQIHLFPILINFRFTFPIFLKLTFYFEIVVDSQSIVRNNTESQCALYPVFPNRNTLSNNSVLSVAENANWYREDTEHIHHHKDSSVCPVIAKPTSLLFTLLWPSTPGNYQSILHFCNFVICHRTLYKCNHVIPNF